jgi:hypothetical protein
MPNTICKWALSQPARILFTFMPCRFVFSCLSRCTAICLRIAPLFGGCPWRIRLSSSRNALSSPQWSAFSIDQWPQTHAASRLQTYITDVVTLLIRHHVIWFRHASTMAMVCNPIQSSYPRSQVMSLVTVVRRRSSRPWPVLCVS